MKNQFDPKKTIYLIDGSTFLYRAYYSMRPLTTSKNIQVQGVYVFCKMIKKIINLFDPHMMTLIWDSKGPTDRVQIYSDYKAGRQSAPSDLFHQKELIMKFAELIGLVQLERLGAEADDIINSLVQDYKNQDYNIVVIASDKDLQQLIDYKVFIYDSFKQELIDTTSFNFKMGFTVDKLIFYFALLGDTSDNIPGVKGIGKKGASDLVNQFSSLEDLYLNIDRVTNERTKKILLENKENAFLSYDLFKLMYYKMEVPIQRLKFEISNWINAKPLFQELEFKSLLVDMEDVHESHIEQKPFFADEKGYLFKSITTDNELKELAIYLSKKNSFAIDTETDGLNPDRCNLVGISISAQKGLAFYIPCGHKNIEQQLTLTQIKDSLNPIFENAKIKKYLHNSNFDRRVLNAHQINLEGIEFDTLIAASIALEGNVRLGLKSLSYHFFQEKMISFEEVVKNKKLKNFSYCPLEDATKYAAGDAHQTFALKEILEKKLVEKNLMELFEKVEMPLCNVLFKMEEEGILIDINVLREISLFLDKELKKIEKDIHILSGLEELINLNSPKQIVDLLFNKLNLQPVKKSQKKTIFSTDQGVLEELSKVHIIPKLLLSYRELSKLKNTYVDALPEYINPQTGRVHTTFSQTVTATGRLSSFDPNLQNIPADNLKIRSAFVPKEGHMFLSADYSQIELRILAYFSQDKNLMEAFLNNEDIHSKTAAYIFNVNQTEVTHQQRQIGKKINFSVMYGLTPYGLSKDLKISVKDAKNYIDRFFGQYPQVLLWMEQTINFVKENGYVETFFGRRRYLPGIYEKNRILYDLARRMAINTPAQGTAADIMKSSMVKLTNLFEKNNLDAQILIQIHDELLISVSKEQLTEVESLTKQTLEYVVDWNIPLVVTTRFGKNWQEVTK